MIPLENIVVSLLFVVQYVPVFPVQICHLSIVHKGVSTPHFKIIPPPPPHFLKFLIAQPYVQIGHPKFSLLTEMQLWN